MSKERILSLLASRREDMRARFGVKELGVFGSAARDDMRYESDVDILVEVEPSIGLGFVTLAERLEKLLGQPVDLVSRRAIKPSLWQRIEPELIDA